MTTHDRWSAPATGFRSRWRTGRRWLDRAATWRRRRVEVQVLRDRFRAPDEPSDDEVKLADELGRLRRAIVAASGTARSCATCAVGCPPPNGHWAGGFCCGGETDRVFTDDEVAGLRLGGTAASDLRLPPGEEQAGCVFRGPEGCSLAGEHRPQVCVRYVCSDLSRDLFARGALTTVEALCQALDETFARFVAVRTERRADAEVATLFADAVAESPL